MTGDDAIKTGLGILAAVGGTVASAFLAAWASLRKAVRKNREDALVAEGRIKALEAKVGQIDRTALTTDCVRGVVNEALDRRDREAAERRTEWDRRLALEIRQTVHEELERGTKRIVREVLEHQSRQEPGRST